MTNASACGTQIDHAIVIVGYNTTNNPPYWTIRNSWGTSWGESGYGQVEITSGAGVCEINSQPAYPYTNNI